VESLKPTDHGAWEVGWGHRTTECDAVVAAIQPASLKELLGGLDAEWGKLLERIPAHDSATLNMGFRRQDVAHPLDGFGFVVPAVERKMVLGCTFASRKFEGRAPEGKVLLRAFLGKEAVGLLKSNGETAVREWVLGELKDILGLKADPLFHHLAVYRSAMSYYRPGHLSQAARLEQKATEFKGLYLAGNGLKGVGIPDCVAAGQRAAEKLIRDRLLGS
jgi:oxygen-dependent protoporphyrinogen oxidase